MFPQGFFGNKPCFCFWNYFWQVLQNIIIQNKCPHVFCRKPENTIYGEGPFIMQLQNQDWQHYWIRSTPQVPSSEYSENLRTAISTEQIWTSATETKGNSKMLLKLLLWVHVDKSCRKQLWRNSFLIVGLESHRETFRKFVKMYISYRRVIVRLPLQTTLQHSKPFSLKTPTQYHIVYMKH